MRQLSLALLLAPLALAQLPTVPNSDFPTFRTNLNNSLQKGANITLTYSNPAWILTLAGTKITGTLPPGTIPFPTLTTIGGVRAKDCTGIGHVLSVNTDGTLTCSADGGSGSGLPAHCSDSSGDLLCTGPITASSFIAPGPYTASGPTQTPPTVSTPTMWFDTTSGLPQYKSAANVLAGTMVVPANLCSGGTPFAAGYNADGTPNCVATIATTTASTQALGVNTTAIATTAFVNNQICSIAQFNPAADGSTDDSAVFNTAQATCSTIMLTPGKAYAFGTNRTMTAGLIFISPPSGGALVIKTGITVNLNGTLQAPVAKLFSYQGTGVVTVGPNTPSVNAEWFGAIGDNSTDDLGSIQAALNSITSGGTVTLLNKTYKTTAAIVMKINGSRLKGQGFSSLGASSNFTVINSNSATADIIQMTASSGANCSVTTDGMWLTVSDLIVTRSATPSGTAKNIDILNACWATVQNVESDNFVSGIYVAGSGDTQIRNVQTSGGSAAITKYGINIDSTTTANFSTYVFGHVASTAAGTMTGVYLHGACIADTYIKDGQTANTDYGMQVVSAGGGGTYCDGDVHILNAIWDQVKTVGLYVSGVIGARPTVEVGGCHIAMNTSVSTPIGVDIENASGVNLHGCQIASGGSGAIGVKLGTGAINNNIQDNKFDLVKIGLQINASSENLVTGNVFTATSSQTSTAHIDVTGTSVANIVTNNMVNGYATTGIALGASATLTTAYGNTIDTTHMTNAFTDSGTANVKGFPAFLSFYTGNVVAVSSTISGFQKVAYKSTVENLQASANAFTCSVNPVITFYECGTSTTCSGPTTIGSVTLTTAGTVVTGTVSNPNVAAGDYVAWAVSAGTCTVLNAGGTSLVRTNAYH